MTKPVALTTISACLVVAVFGISMKCLNTVPTFNVNNLSVDQLGSDDGTLLEEHSPKTVGLVDALRLAVVKARDFHNGEFSDFTIHAKSYPSEYGFHFYISPIVPGGDFLIIVNNHGELRLIETF